MVRRLLKLIKGALLQAVNSIPVSSMHIGSPRHTSTASALKHQQAGASYSTVRRAVAVVEKPPVTIDDEIFFKYEKLYHRTEPEQFILTLNNGRVWGRNGAIITANDIFISDLSQEFGRAKTNPHYHAIWRQLKLKKPIEVDGSVAVIAAPGGKVYAHWLCDMLPRLLLLRDAGILQKADKIVMSIGFLDYQLKTLQRLGIDPDKIINTFDDVDFHLRAKTVYVASYPNANATVNGWVSDAVRKLFIQADRPSLKNRRLYISREKANGRQVINENNLVALLANKYGFEKIFAEDYSIEEIARLFYDAECVMGPHGGGFTNLVFCAPGCKVIDMFPPEDFTTYFWVMANAASLEYAYFFGEGDRATKHKDIFKRNANINVDISKVETLLKKMKVHPLRGDQHQQPILHIKTQTHAGNN